MTVDASGTVKAAAFKSGWSASATTTAAYVFNFGTLAPPSISPSPGTYLHGQPITLSGPAGATQHGRHLAHGHVAGLHGAVDVVLIPDGFRTRLPDGLGAE